MTSTAQLTQLELASVKVDASSFSGGTINPGTYKLQSAAWPHLFLGLRNGLHEEGVPVDTIPVPIDQAEVWDLKPEAGSTDKFTIGSGGVFQRAVKPVEKEGIIGSKTKQTFAITEPHADFPGLYSIQVDGTELALYAVSGSGGNQAILQAFDKKDTRQVWVLVPASP